MSLSIFFITFSIVFYLMGAIPYVYHIFHGRVVPHPFSYTVWAILSIINTILLIYNAGISYLIVAPIISTLFLCFWSVVGWLLLKKVKISLFDYLCLALAIVVIAIAYSFGLEDAIIPSICVDLLLLAPTVKKFWKNPRSEDVLGWLGAGISKLFLLCSLWLYAISYDNIWWWYSMIVNLGVALVIYKRTQFTENWMNKIKSVVSIFAVKKKLW